MKKRFYLIPMLAPLVIAACVPIDTPTEAPTCGVETPAEVIGYTKEGSPIRMEPTLIAPCPEISVTTTTTTKTPPVVPPIVPPVEPPVIEPPIDPPVEPPKPKKPNVNAGRGNGSEGGPDVDPGKSGGRNKGGD